MKMLILTVVKAFPFNRLRGPHTERQVTQTLQLSQNGWQGLKKKKRNGLVILLCQGAKATVPRTHSTPIDLVSRNLHDRCRSTL